jgi:stress response protein YsnF
VSRDRDDNDDNAVVHFFKSLFSDNDDEADRYSNVARNSRCMVTVHAGSGDEAERAADILDNCGAIDVDERAKQNSSSTTNRSGDYTHRSTHSGLDNRSNRNEATIPKMEERLNVGKRVEEGSGGVRVRSRIVERPVEEHVRLREEHVNVERQPVDRPVSPDDMRNFQDKEIEFTERNEVPVVNKEARVVEEIRLSKEVTERDETIRDNVRHTEVDIDKIKDKDSSDRTDRTDDLR